MAAIPPLILRALLDTAVPERTATLVPSSRSSPSGSRSRSGLSLVQRWYSAKIGEGLIYDLRIALFDHVQRLPLSFFTRTQTGALMSRMNNDVIGAQQAVTNTLGTVVSNVITPGGHAELHARARLAPHDPHAARAAVLHHPGPPDRQEARVITREGMQLNASMNNTVVERFNVPARSW